jgi:hypothetical protein
MKAPEGRSSKDIRDSDAPRIRKLPKFARGTLVFCWHPPHVTFLTVSSASSSLPQLEHLNQVMGIHLIIAFCRLGFLLAHRPLPVRPPGTHASHSRRSPKSCWPRVGMIRMKQLSLVRHTLMNDHTGELRRSGGIRENKDCPTRIGKTLNYGRRTPRSKSGFFCKHQGQLLEESRKGESRKGGKCNGDILYSERCKSRPQARMTSPSEGLP